MHHITKQSARALGLILLLGAGLVFTTAPVKGQVSIEPGVRVGLNSATVGGDTEEYVQAFSGIGGGTGFDFEIDLGRRTGFLIGGYALVDLAGPLAIQPELRYIQKGFGYDLTASFQGQSQTASGSLNLSYLDIPVLARVDLPFGGALSPHLIAGPRVGINLSAESESPSLNGGGSETTDVSDSVSGTDFGLELGAGLSVSTVTVDLRYGLGLSNIVDAEGADVSLSNRSLMVTAGLTF